MLENLRPNDKHQVPVVADGSTVEHEVAKRAFEHELAKRAVACGPQDKVDVGRGAGSCNDGKNLKKKFFNCLNKGFL